MGDFIKRVLVLSAMIMWILIIPVIFINNEYSYTVEATTKVKINETRKTINVGEKYRLKVKGTKEKVKWSTSNKKIATVNAQGEVKGKKKGTCTITAKIGKKRYSCKITVKQPVKLNKTKKTINVGEKYRLKVTGTKEKVKWSTSNKKIATVNAQGEVKGKKKGTCTITAKIGKKRYSCKITVKQPVKELKLNKRSLDLDATQKYTLKVKISPSNASNKKATCKVRVISDAISTEKELLQLNGEEGVFKLAKDIKLSDDFKTIKYFYGVLDGNGYKILNAKKTLIEENWGTIKNIDFVDCDIVAQCATVITFKNEGTIYGCNVYGKIKGIVTATDLVNVSMEVAGITIDNTGTIEKCNNFASIFVDGEYVSELGSKRTASIIQAAGISIQSQRILKCNNYGKIVATGAECNMIAGIVIQNNDEITKCANYGNLISNKGHYKYASGIVSDNTGKCFYCYNTGSIFCNEGQDYTDFESEAGICNDNSGKITNCYNIGSSEYGLVSNNENTVIDCYYLENISTYGVGGFGIGDSRVFIFSLKDLSKQSTFSKFDFNTIWKISDKGPIFKE